MFFHAFTANSHAKRIPPSPLGFSAYDNTSDCSDVSILVLMYFILRQQKARRLGIVVVQTPPTPPPITTTTTAELDSKELITVQEALEILAAALKASGESRLDAIEIQRLGLEVNKQQAIGSCSSTSNVILPEEMISLMAPFTKLMRLFVLAA